MTWGPDDLVEVELLDDDAPPLDVTVIWPWARPWMQTTRGGMPPNAVDDDVETYWACACLAGHPWAMAVERHRWGGVGTVADA